LVSGIKSFEQSGVGTLILSGGGLPPDSEKEAEVIGRVTAKLGVLGKKTMTETNSHNTMEHAIELTELLSQKKNRRIGLVTSAFHMLRSAGAFRKQFSADTIVPVPEGHVHSPQRYNLKSLVPSAGASSISSNARHEWIGIVWYSMRY
jgi:uncharacterized SAM-binding protein YcdF (DUF218 family)